jgi:hypothetical protein
MRFAAELCDPLDVLTGFWIEGGGEVRFERAHVAGPGVAPLGLVGGPGNQGGGADGDENGMAHDGLTK